MSTKVTGLERGIGSPGAVMAHWLQSWSADGIVSEMTPNLLGSIERVVNEPLTTVGMLAILASILNVRIVETGRVWTLDSTGRLDGEYISSSGVREAIQSAISD